LSSIHGDAKADQILRKFILDPVAREYILLAWLNDDVTLENVEQYAVEPQEEPVSLRYQRRTCA
jgi:hypothetical protein